MRNKIIIGLLVAVVAAFIYANFFMKKTDITTTDQPPVNATPVAPLQMTSIKELPHDTAAYTEGIEFYKGHLYESAGDEGKSFLVKYEKGSTNKAAIKKANDPTIFAEGITILNDTIYQLTYRNNIVLLYDAITLKQIGTLPWTLGEGWGMTNNGKQLIANTGTNIIYFLNPKDLKVEKTINVKIQGTPADSINEMELVDGFIYANQFTTDNILKIDPNTGDVVAMMELSKLLPGYDAASLRQINGQKYLNGIAYNPETKTFFITGKNWPKMFEVNFK
jgi:glutaminyl-peptide cyclotransferase